MTTIARCPNPSCGRVSHLGADQLGRIFRCPRCLTKLPTGATDSDSGWTAVLGPLPRRAAEYSTATSAPPVYPVGTTPKPTGSATMAEEGSGGVAVFASGESPALASGEFHVGAFDDDFDESRDDHPAAASGFEWSESARSAYSAPALGRTDATGTDLAALPAPRWEPDGPTVETSTLAVDRGLKRFRIMGLLGEGRHAAVYRAFDPTLERQVALKLLREGGPRSPRAHERFLGEARALARLRHPGIVSIHEAGRDGDQLYLVLDLIEGKSLAEALAESRFSPRRSAEAVAALADALAYAHGLGIVHRDVKPANIRVDLRGGVHLMDFGIAYRPDSREAPTLPGAILGTPAYIAPERVEGERGEVLPASDQYSLGAVLYELLCGRPPFEGSPSYVLFHAANHEPPDPRALDRRAPRPLVDICRKAMSKRPESRYPSCADLAADLRRWIQGERPQARRRSWLG